MAPVTSEHDLGHERYADRFDASTYADYEPVGVFTSTDDPNAVWLPERLFHRLVAVGRGYDLHLMPRLGGSEPVTEPTASREIA